MVLQHIKQALLYGFLIWLIPFAIATILFPVRGSDRIFFESLMPVTLTIVTVFFAVRYFKLVSGISFKEGLMLGVLWMLMSIVFDIPFFFYLFGNTTFIQYWKDVAFTYFIIPAIVGGFGTVSEKYQNS